MSQRVLRFRSYDFVHVSDNGPRIKSILRWRRRINRSNNGSDGSMRTNRIEKRRHHRVGRRRRRRGDESGGRTSHVRRGSRNARWNRRYGRRGRRRRIRRNVTRSRRSHKRHIFNVIRHRITRHNERTRETEQIRESTNGPTNVT